MDAPLKVRPKTLAYAGAITALGGIATTVATTKRGRRLRSLAPNAVVLGSSLMVVAYVKRRSRKLTNSEIYQQGYEAGRRDGRREAKPVVVPMRKCNSDGDSGNPCTGT